jgi:hypothetical protein
MEKAHLVLALAPKQIGDLDVAPTTPANGK